MSWSTQPIRFGGGYTVALAPHFQGPRPKDRGSVGSALVCRWPPGGVSGALRPPQSPQDSGETSLTSLWQPYRKVKQRGRKVRVSGLLLGKQVRRWPHNPPAPLPFVSFPGFSLTRFTDSVSKLWVHALEGSRSSWSTKREPTLELAKQEVTPSCAVRCADASGVSVVHLAGDFMAKLHGVQFLAYFSSAYVVKWPVGIGNPFTRVLAGLAVPITSLLLLFRLCRHHHQHFFHLRAFPLHHPVASCPGGRLYGSRFCTLLQRSRSSSSCP